MNKYILTTNNDNHTLVVNLGELITGSLIKVSEKQVYDFDFDKLKELLTTHLLFIDFDSNDDAPLTSETLKFKLLTKPDNKEIFIHGVLHPGKNNQDYTEILSDFEQTNSILLDDELIRDSYNDMTTYNILENTFIFKQDDRVYKINDFKKNFANAITIITDYIGNLKNTMIVPQYQLYNDEQERIDNELYAAPNEKTLKYITEQTAFIRESKNEDWQLIEQEIKEG